MSTLRIYCEMFRRLVYPILDLLFPAACHACRGELRKSAIPFFCEACWSGIRPLEGPFCPQCGKPFSSSSALSFSPGHRCGDCRSAPPFFDRMTTPYSFDGVLAKGLFLYKYNRKVALASPLSALILPFLESIGKIDLILPVPLHPERLREREFNQSLLLGNILGREFKKPLKERLLIKVKPTEHQMKLNRRDRRKNLKHSFAVSDPKKIAEKRVLLVDDVFTTGATMNECAKVLKKAGCREVAGCAIARTLLKK